MALISLQYCVHFPRVPRLWQYRGIKTSAVSPCPPCLEGPGLYSAVSVGAQQVQCARTQDPSRLEAPTPPLQQHKRHVSRDLESQENRLDLWEEY